MNIVYENRLPTVTEYIALRKTVGWSDVLPEVVATALNNSLFGVCAIAEDQTIDSGQVIGSGRVIGDGGLAFYVQDVMVLPRFQQRFGIGREIMLRIFDYLNQTAYSFSDTGLMAASGVEPFYEKLGCIARPNHSMGAGMHCPLTS